MHSERGEHGPGYSDLSEPERESSPRWRRRRPNPKGTRDSAVQCGGDRRGGESEGARGEKGPGWHTSMSLLPWPALPGGPASLSISRPSRSACNPPECHPNMPCVQKAGMGRAEREKDGRWMHHPSVFILPPISPMVPVQYAHLHKVTREHRHACLPRLPAPSFTILLIHVRILTHTRPFVDRVLAGSAGDGMPVETQH